MVEAVDVVQAGFFVFFRHGCLEVGWGRGGGGMMDVKVVIKVVVGVVGVVCGVRMGMAVSCIGTRGEGVVNSGGSVSVTDGRGAGWKDCCRFPNGIFWTAPGRPPIPSPIHAQYR